MTDPYASDLCTCGHVRKHHEPLPKPSPNYTDGACQHGAFSSTFEDAPTCLCQHFNIA